MSDDIPPSTASSAGAAQRRWVIGIGLLLLSALAWLWIDMRGEVQDLRRELAGKLRETDSDSRDARAAARQAQEAVRDAQVHITQLESKMAESQSQQTSLESLYQELSRDRDEWVLAEVEQILAIASQQLQLAGNIQAALVALQTADARLARSERPQLIAVRKAMARDIERLKNAPNVDVVGLALKIDQVIAAVENLPLSTDERAPSPRESEARDEGFWARLGSGIWDELRQLVRVRNIEQPEAPLLSPTQAYFLKQNLRLRLLNARLALLDRNEPVLRADLEASNAWLARYFDMRAKPVIAASASLKQVSQGAIGGELPSVAESLAAVRSFKTAKDKTTR
ncbi:MAG: uroporphyrinogen-III C-methyltransferase [Burkholderiales bacterium]